MQNEALYTKGFNNGYLLAKFESSLLVTILRKLTPSGDYLEGMFLGKEKYEIEHNRTQLNELDNLRKKLNERDLDREM